MDAPQWEPRTPRPRRTPRGHSMRALSPRKGWTHRCACLRHYAQLRVQEICTPGRSLALRIHEELLKKTNQKHPKPNQQKGELNRNQSTRLKNGQRPWTCPETTHERPTKQLMKRCSTPATRAVQSTAPWCQVTTTVTAATEGRRESSTGAHSNRHSPRGRLFVGSSKTGDTGSPHDPAAPLRGIYCEGKVGLGQVFVPPHLGAA